MPNTKKIRLGRIESALLRAMNQYGYEIYAVNQAAQAVTDLDFIAGPMAATALKDARSSFDKTIHDMAAHYGLEIGPDEELLVNPWLEERVILQVIPKSKQLAEAEWFTSTEVTRDPLAEIAALSGPERLFHKDFPAYAAACKDAYLSVLDEAIEKSTDASQIQELQDVRNFIIDAQKDYVAVLSPIAKAETVSA